MKLCHRLIATTTRAAARRSRTVPLFAAILCAASLALPLQVPAHGVAPKAGITPPSVGTPPAAPGIVPPVVAPPVVTPPSAPPGRAISQAARDATTRLADLGERHGHAALGQRPVLAAQAFAAARERFEALVELAAADPAEVLRVALPADVLAKLPAQAIPFLERSAEESGELEVLHVDHVDNSADYYVYALTTAKGKFPLYLAGNTGELATGARVRLRGIWLGDALVADTSELTVSKATALPNTLGAQKTLVILVNFSNAPAAQPYTLAQAHNVVFGTTSNYDYEASYQQTTLTGTVAGWFTIAETNTTCNYSNIATQAKQKAAAAGHVLSNYNRLVYVFPSNACGWWGLGSVGGNPSQAWIHTRHGFSLAVVGHELGHNLGLYHSHSMDCGTSPLASGGCSTSDYGDVLDIMGTGAAHFNAFQKERLGWLDAGVSPPITTVPAQAGTATYTITPLEDPRNGSPRALKIPRGTACAATNEWFYVESRQAKGFDSFLANNANVLGGVLVRKATQGNGDSSYLLDMTPATSTFSDAALVAGLSFTDPVSGVVISPVSVGSAGAVVNVTFPPASCTRAAPAVTLAPASTVWTSAGASVTYSVSVTNRDSCGCAATTYDVGASPPTGWSATNARTASIAPGASTSTSIVVTSPSSAAAAFYTIGIAAANSAASTLVAASAGTVSIAGATALSVSAVTDKSTYTRPTKGNGNISATITTSVRSGTSGVGGASVTVEVRDPAGRITKLSGVTGANGALSLNHSMKARQAVVGTYTVTSRAVIGGSSGSATTTFALK